MVTRQQGMVFFREETRKEKSVHLVDAILLRGRTDQTLLLLRASHA